MCASGLRTFDTRLDTKIHGVSQYAGVLENGPPGGLIDETERLRFNKKTKFEGTPLYAGHASDKPLHS